MKKLTILIKLCIFSIIVMSFANCGDETPKDETTDNVSETEKTNLKEDNKQGILKDNRDGKEYKIIKIGNQWWIAENLSYKPNNGKYWAYNNNDNKVSTYGYLYDWNTACKTCPDGWHLPTMYEWNELINYLDGDVFGAAGYKMIESGGNHWRKSNINATNESIANNKQYVPN